VSFEIDLSGRRALVTGAGQHVGRVIALALARSGAEVLVNDLRAERCERVAREIAEAGGRGRPAVFDVRDRVATQRCIGELSPDILVNNVGDTGAGDAPGERTGRHRWRNFVDSDLAEWDAFLAVNLLGVLHCAHAAAPAMIERGWGRIITIISDAARVPERGMSAYAAAKAGAAGFSRALAAELGRSGVTVNCVSLGTIQSEHAKEITDPDRQRASLRGYLVPRLGRPEDPASLVVFLASAHADWITAQTIPVNGGYSSAL
jgi:3-oxoacyl-[acyl-carrier protein] reductase